jgi:recombination protein RecT
MSNAAANSPSKGEFQNTIAKLSNPKESITVRAKALAQMVDVYSADITAILPKHVDFHRMKQLFILSVKNTPTLLDCDPASLMKSLFTAASMGLEPDPYFGQVYLLPYGKNVQVIPGYKGLLRLVHNSGEITSISAQAVYENDEFDYDLASGERPKHRPSLKDGRGQAIAYYCLANFRDGGFHFELMTKEEIEGIRLRSAAVKSGRSTPWKTDYDEMAKKTVIRRAVKRLPISLSRETRNALIAEDAYHAGKAFELDQETGEAIDIWAEAVEETPNPKEETQGQAPSRLDTFAGTQESPQASSPDSSTPKTNIK